MEGHQQFNYFSGLSVVRCRNVELMTLNIALLGRQPKYYEIPSSFELALFFVFLIAFQYIFCFWTFCFCCFNMFVSFSRLTKGASTVTKGFACSLQCERAKFVF